MQLPWHLYVMAVMYILAGINHFRRPRLYLKIIPPYFPKPKLLNALSGFAEIALGVLLCIPATSPYAALGLIALLICIFPANLFMYQNETARLGFSKWLLLLRLPLQVVLIAWAYAYTSIVK
ncbi:MAG TPA: DoxX family membrane protein [Flavobacterium sp.]|jgi:uncharacterized membrane protein|nr:DoxX family membrane protein [Flavobacterium sp.]HPJ09039.1 DoxX family membrane protein [Flavobacterium sp.]